MRGYGFSVWLLPRKREKLLNLLKEKMNIRISHIPHITIKTNFEKKVDAQEFAKTLNSSYNLEIRGSLHLGNKYYKVEPLNFWVFPVFISGLDIPKAHLSTTYMKNRVHPIGYKINFSDKGDVIVANTESDIPREWYLTQTYF